MRMNEQQQILKEAINDYPKKDLNSASELLAELYKSIHFPITFSKLKQYMDNIDLHENAWEAESYASLLKLFHGNEGYTLEEIFTKIEKL